MRNKYSQKGKEYWRGLVMAGLGSGNRRPKQWLAANIAKQMGLSLKREEHRRIIEAIQQRLVRDE
jgi:hypothetical protein